VVVRSFKSDGMNGREDEEELGNVGNACENVGILKILKLRQKLGMVNRVETCEAK
jgi:hypothetical protein